ncbi:MAG TPA: spore coat protein [Thermoanaerobacterales bacterium]|nr:spore coat protein [Thermoanaerobacterales bacterium]
MNLNDKDIANIMLNQHKHEAATLTNFILECSNEQMRRDAQNALMQVFNHQKQIFDIMNQRGWYKIQPADPQQLSRAQQEISNIQQDMMQM